MNGLISLYKGWRGIAPVAVEKLPGAGSNRRYYRMMDADGGSVIGAIGTSREENNAFIYLSDHFTRAGLSVPQVIAIADDGQRYLQTDLGNVSLFDAMKSGRNSGGKYSHREKELLVMAIRELPNIQVRGAEGLDWNNCYPLSEFNTDSVFFDLNYFKYCFLKTTGVDFHEMKLETDFRLFAKDLTAEPADTFMYRDFQARNVMLSADGNPCFIDFQGGRKGPVYYDLASFLWQASAKYSDELRSELVYEYYEALKKYTVVPEMQHFSNRLGLFVLFRMLQVLGAYGFRGYFERKKHFLDSIPPAIKNLRELPNMTDMSRYPYMADVLGRLTELPGFVGNGCPVQGEADRCKGTDKPFRNRHPQERSAAYSDDGNGQLVVRVFSFSYRKGIPEDNSGNGGGYVFDCRSTNNPGRYEAYRELTGLDEPVIRFLEDDGEILTFLESVYRLADVHVQRYIRRGFTDLMFSFGCTGGRHRSVYSAQHLAEFINRKYGVEVRLCHREQGIEQVLERRS